MKDLHADKRALNTALNESIVMVNDCEGAARYVVKDDNRYLVKKESIDYVLKVEFKSGKINVIDPKKEERKAKKTAKKVLPEVQEDSGKEID